MSTRPLILSTFPGIDLLGMAFEMEGFCVVRGPDPIFGGDIRGWNVPVGRFDGVIGGPPCQAHSTYANLNRKRGNKVAECLIHEFVRVVSEAKPRWWVMENVPKAPDVVTPGYVVRRMLLDNRWFGEEQRRRRAWQYGTEVDAYLDVGGSLVVLENPVIEPAVLASEGRAGKLGNKRTGANGQQRTTYTPRRTWSKFCELQGLPPTFLERAPWTVEGKYRAVGNGVPLAMGRAIASAVRRALYPEMAA